MGGISVDHKLATRPDRARLLPELRAALEAADLDPQPANAELGAIRARANAEIRLSGHWGKKDLIAAPLTFTLPNGASGVRARLYRGGGNTGRTMLFFHGGGWVAGSLDTHDGAARALALGAACNLLSVEYRKAPEAPFPAGLDDASASLAWLRADGAALGLDAESIIIAGDSAGANIAAALSLRCRAAGIPLHGQILIYPATDMRLGSDSIRTFADGFFLTRTNIEWFVAQYLAGGTPATDPLVSPLLAPDLTGLPSALIVTADHDPLRDEGRAYAARLIEAGIWVTYEEWQGVTHGFMLMDRVTPAARRLIGRMAEWSRAIWRG